MKSSQKLWDFYPELNPKIGSRTYGTNIRFVFHIYPGAKTNESKQHIDDWIASSQDSDANQSTPEPCPHQKCVYETNERNSDLLAKTKRRM